MINKVLFFFAFLLLLASCKNQTATKKTVSSKKNTPLSRNELVASVKQMEDSIMSLINSPKPNAKILSLSNVELINRLVSFYQAFPKDPYSAECLFKIHEKYSELQAHKKALDYGDTLLVNFSNYPNREFLLESMCAIYDVEIAPRDTTSLRKYYTLLLKEAKVTPEKRKEIQMRLKYIGMNFFEYAEFKNKQTSNVN
jgi:lipoprotein NlpI